MSFAVEGPVLEIKSLGPAPKVITVRVEPIAKRVRAYVDGAAIADSRHGPSSRAHGTPTAGGRHNRRYEMSSQVQPFALEPGAGTSVRNPVGGQLVFKLRGEQSNGAMTVFETVAAPEEGPPLHFHQLQDEWLYVLEGETSPGNVRAGGARTIFRTLRRADRADRRPRHVPRTRRRGGYDRRRATPRSIPPDLHTGGA